jgi:hypothetical protein
VVAGIHLDWETHERRAQGSDNWQLTWADDGHQYAPWGDGGGFEGTNSLGRVSLGVARIEGAWNAFKGVNVWGGYQAGNPATTTGKSWGIISVSGALYMWVSPGSPLKELQKEACLYVSRDHAATWQRADWCFRLDDKLSVPKILQFGRDHAMTPDDYVYHYFVRPTSSVDFVAQRPGAIYLLRSPKTRLLDRSSYEFFTGIQSDGKPAWSRDTNAKKPVFEDPNGVGWNLSVTWNAGLRRYLLITEHTESSKGNMGVFDAAQPWGPWTTVEYLNHSEAKQFGAGKVDADTFYRNIPLKWQSAEGLDFTLVFTGAGRGKGNDSWNSIRGRFVRRK